MMAMTMPDYQQMEVDGAELEHEVVGCGGNLISQSHHCHLYCLGLSSLSVWNCLLFALYL